MDIEAVRAAVTLDSAWCEQLHAEWSQIMALALWGKVKSSRLGAMGRVRRRILDVGEKLASLCAAREWIPHPREQLKNALGSAISLKDSLAQLERAVVDADTGLGVQQFNDMVQALLRDIAAQLPVLENSWAELLDTQYIDEEEDDDDD